MLGWVRRAMRRWVRRRGLGRAYDAHMRAVHHARVRRFHKHWVDYFDTVYGDGNGMISGDLPDAPDTGRGDH